MCVLTCFNEFQLYPKGLNFCKTHIKRPPVFCLSCVCNGFQLFLINLFPHSHFPCTPFSIPHSYNIEITGSLTVDAYAVSTGIQVSGSAHSSTGAELDVALLNDGHGIDINLRLPQKKEEILTVDHRIVFVTQERGQETVTNNLKFSARKKEFSGCFDQLAKYAGVTFCADVSVTMPGGTNPAGGGAPVAPFPLNGANKISVWLEVEEAYNFRTVYATSDETHQSLEVAFDTPGSEIPRLTVVKLETATKPAPFVRINLDSPHRKASIESGLVNDKAEAALFVTAVNGPDQYHAKFGFTKSGAPPRQEYTPIVLFKTPNKSDDNVLGYKVTGSIVVDSSSAPTRYTFNNVEVRGIDPAPITANGWVEIDGQKFRTDMEVRQGERRATLVGDTEIAPRHLKMDMGVTSNFCAYANGKVVIDFEYGEKFVSRCVLLVWGGFNFFSFSVSS